MLKSITLNAQKMDSMQLKVGDTLRLKFVDQISMGFTWQLEDTLFSSYMDLVNNKLLPSPEDVDGGNQEREFIFIAKNKGIYAVSFILRRGFSESQKPRERRTFYLHIDS
jgi:predicted secreted protein